MRLICPNCDAQYEVPDEVMPPEGRDVQCSNCGQTWFQDHPDALAEAEAAELAAPQDDEEDVATAPDRLSQEDAPQLAAALPDEPASEPEDTAPRTPPEPVQRRVDPAVASVLREEAELEARARRNELPDALETQPDLGLPEAGTGDDAARRSDAAGMQEDASGKTDAQARDATQGTAAAAAAIAGSRRDLLPDIEEINSTLRSNSDRGPGGDPGQTAQAEVLEKRSSRRGFVLVVALVAVLALVYVYAPQIAEALPQLENALQTYVAVIDDCRVWLDARVAAILSWLDDVAVSSSQ
ncbi:zinc-ribbon domain-containing protein [uncultured Roseobacter sp.]|uniref:zinc-ribbon domain-containing protein n=1 Tax=uncultured Roseobacter sp. TaxID=114847 RepID=UPI002622ABD7|nr:zinc-ribbon domain-containing protein [uncultured Roseobacter sp.]